MCQLADTKSQLADETTHTIRWQMQTFVGFALCASNTWCWCTWKWVAGGRQQIWQWQVCDLTRQRDDFTFSELTSRQVGNLTCYHSTYGWSLPICKDVYSNWAWTYLIGKMQWLLKKMFIGWIKLTKTSHPKVIWEQCIALAQLPNKVPLVTMGCPTLTLKTAPTPSTITTPSNRPIPQLTPLTTPNGIRIQYTFRTDRQTHTQIDRWDRW